MFKKLLALALAASTLLVGATASAFTSEMLEDNGPNTNRVNIVIVGDGYRAEDQDLLREHAIRITDNLWNNPSFGDYRNYFNVKLIHSVSADDGAVGGNNPPTQPTIFQSYFNCQNIDRLLCIGDTTRLAQVLDEDAPEYDSRFDIVLVTVNDSKYGGAGGSYATTSAHPTAPEIAIHELGHSFAGLADEYDYGGEQSTTEFSEPNVTIYSQREQIKWLAWILPSTPVPTPETPAYNNVVGVFEGARYFPTGHFRPWQNCMMNNLGMPFCPVCRETIVTSVYEKTDPIEEHTPASNSVTLLKNKQRTFSFNGPVPAPNTLDVSWWVDNVQKASNVQQITLKGSNLVIGYHHLELRVKDQTASVRNDPQGVLSSTFKWTVQVKNPFLPCGTARKCCKPKPGGCALCIPKNKPCPVP